MLKGNKSLLEYTNLFFSNDYEKNDKIIKKFFLWIYFKKVRKRKIYCTRCKKYKEFKKPKIYICDKTLLLSSICKKCRCEDEQMFKEE